MVDYGPVHQAVSDWWAEHSTDYKCEPCGAGLHELPEVFGADAAWSGLETMLELATNAAGDSLRSDGFGMGDIDESSATEFTREVVEFCHDAGRDVQGCGLGAGQVGYDFVLTRNGHGAGFWDRGLGEAGDRLTAAAHSYGESGLYVGDDGRLHVG